MGKKIVIIMSLLSAGVFVLLFYGVFATIQHSNNFTFEKAASSPYSVIEGDSADDYVFAYYDENGEQQKFYECEEGSCSSEDHMILFTYTKFHSRYGYRIENASIRVNSVEYELSCGTPSGAIKKLCIPTRPFVPVEKDDEEKY